MISITPEQTFYAKRLIETLHEDINPDKEEFWIARHYLAASFACHVASFDARLLPESGYDTPWKIGVPVRRKILERNSRDGFGNVEFGTVIGGVILDEIELNYAI